MNDPKEVLRKEGQSASNPKLKCRICILEIQAGHYVGFVFGTVESGITHCHLAEKTQEEALKKSLAKAKEMIPDCVFGA
jgi:hypothetical protein